MYRTHTLTGLGLLLALTGCTATGASPSSGPPPATSSAAIAEAATDSVYVAAARANAPDLSNTLDDASIAAVGRKICADLAAGTPMASIVAAIAGPYGARDAGVLIGRLAERA